MDLLLAEIYYCYIRTSLCLPVPLCFRRADYCHKYENALAEKMWLQYIICSQIRNIALRTLGYCSFVLRHVDAPCLCAHRRHVALPGQTVLGDTYRSCGRVVLGGLRSLAIG